MGLLCGCGADTEERRLTSNYRYKNCGEVNPSLWQSCERLNERAIREEVEAQCGKMEDPSEYLFCATEINHLVLKQIETQYDPYRPDKDCGDFTTQETAAAFYRSAGGPGIDLHKLDEDRDGVPYESLR
jgi:hypothetical protein